MGERRLEPAATVSASGAGVGIALLKRRLKRWESVAVVTTSVVLALLFGGSLLAGTARVAAYGSDLPTDGAQGQFIFAEVARAIWGDGSLLWTDRVWYPAGYPFLLSEQNILDAVLLSPFVRLLGPTLPIAWFGVLVLVTNGLAGGWLARKVADSPRAGVVGAVLLGASPYVLGELSCGRVTQAWLVPMCLTLGLAWDGAKGDLRKASLAGVLLALTGYHYWFYALFIAPGVAAVVLGRVGLKRGIGPLAVIAGVSLLLVAPAVAFVIQHWADMPGTNIDADAFRWPARLLAGLPGLDPGGLDHETRYLPHLLYAVMAGAVLVWPRRVAVSLAAVAGFLVLVSMGQSLTVGDQSVRLPYGWLILIPGLSRFWWPTRALGAATVALTPVAALAFRRLRGASRVAAAGGLLLCVLQAWYLPGRIVALDAPTRVGWSNRAPAGAVLALPMLSEPVGRRASFMQPFHGRPLVNGNGMWDAHLWPPAFRAFYSTQPLLQALLATEIGSKKTTPAHHSSGVSKLASAGVSVVLFPAAWLDHGSAHREVALLNDLLGPPTCLPGDLDCYWIVRGSASDR